MDLWRTTFRVPSIMAMVGGFTLLVSGSGIGAFMIIAGVILWKLRK